MKPVTRLQQIAIDRVLAHWGNGFYQLGSSLQRALVAEQLFRIVAEQSEEVSAERVREIAIENYLWLMSQDEEI